MAIKNGGKLVSLKYTFYNNFSTYITEHCVSKKGEIDQYVLTTILINSSMMETYHVLYYKQNF